jgi:hypothetical protein
MPGAWTILFAKASYSTSASLTLPPVGWHSQIRLRSTRSTFSLDDSLISRLRWTAIRVVSGDARGIEALIALLSMTSLADPCGLLYYSDFVCAR